MYNLLANALSYSILVVGLVFDTIIFSKISLATDYFKLKHYHIYFHLKQDDWLNSHLNSNIVILWHLN